jgi:hypothetical protein
VTGEAKVAKAKELRAEGKTYKEIARALSCSPSAAQRLVKGGSKTARNQDHYTRELRPSQLTVSPESNSMRS